MESISVFLDLIKLFIPEETNADVRRTQGACQVIFMFFGSSIGKI